MSESDIYMKKQSTTNYMKKKKPLQINSYESESFYVHVIIYITDFWNPIFDRLIILGYSSYNCPEPFLNLDCGSVLGVFQTIGYVANFSEV